MILDGINAADIEEKPPQVFASLMSWAIFGAAFEWSKSRPRPPVEEIAGQVVQLITDPLRSRQAGNFSETVRAR